MPSADLGEVTIHYEEHGEGEPLLLIMGVGAQLVHWPLGLCEHFVSRGFRVIRFDNRDQGLSTKFRELGTPDVRPYVLKALLGLPMNPPYTLRDMSSDAARLLEHLGLESAHVVGCSMGGMIAQGMAIHFPERVRTLTSLMSTTGDRYVGKFKAIRALLSPSDHTREGAIARGQRIGQALAGTRFPYDAERYAKLSGEAFDRCHCPDGFNRQMAAILGSGSRRKALGTVRAPTLVIHGTADPLVPLAAGKATAKAIPGAKLELIDDLGHELPTGFWPILADAVARHAGASSPSTAQ